MRWTTAISPTRLRPRSTSGDAIYAAINPADVAVTNTDNDARRHHGHADAGLVTTEARRDGDLHGGADERADRRRDDQPELERHRPKARSPASLTFTAANFSVAQTVTVTGVDEPWSTAMSPTRLRPRSTSGDAIYAAINPADVAVTNTDNDARRHHGDADRRA